LNIGAYLANALTTSQRCNYEIAAEAFASSARNAHHIRLLSFAYKKIVWDYPENRDSH